ncbi:TraR/DksA family transcriptional regulator, partial [Escherichia coli]|uniref:TraR/DksA family transcriptional regulator n=1 Tax=Escherichia coli TaxID=562 RepID=UPI0015947B03
MRDLILQLSKSSIYSTKPRNTAIKMRRLNYQTVSATHCCECGDPIDERRRLVVQGCRTCASCQEEIE